MSYRAYPDADRARHQIERHRFELPPLTAVRPPSPLELKLSETFDALRGAFAVAPVGAYALSTRRSTTEAAVV